MPGDRSCCQVSGAPPVSQKSAVSNQNQDWAQANRVALEVVALNVLAAGQPVFPETVPPPNSSSHQALLCVFLV
jgi:hypothetical protein